MAHITLSGTLSDPTGEFSVGDQVRFTHKSTTGNTVSGAISVLTILPSGFYHINLQYGLVLVEYKDARVNNWKNLGVATVNGTNPATSIPELLNALVPVSSAELIEFQAILADCVSEADRSSDEADRSEVAATTAEAFAYQLTTVDLIASTATFAADTNIPTSGFTSSGDGGGGSWVQNGVTGQTPSQTPAQLGDALLNDGNGNQWKLTVTATTGNIGAVGNVSKDNSLELRSSLVSTNGGNYHEKLLLGSGIFSTSTEFIVDSLTDPSSGVDHRNFILQGQGGFGTEVSTEIRGTNNDIFRSVMTLNSIANLQLKDVAVTSNELNVNSVLRIDADDSPSFSSHVGSVEGCYFNSFASTPADATVKVVNGKNHIFRSNWLGVNSPSDVAIKLGGLPADNTSKLQQGEENCLTLDNNYIFGSVVAERVLNFAITRNSFIENYGSSLSHSAGGIMHCGNVTGNYFTGVNGDANNTTAINIPTDTGQVEDNSCINVTENRFRYRPVGVNVKSKKPVNIWNNFARVNAAGVFIEIQNDAENVTIGPNDFSHVHLVNGAVGIRDLRNEFSVSQPTLNVDKDIVADFVLSADDNSISATNTTQLIGSVSGVDLRGGKYRIRCSVPVRNSTSGKPLIYEWSLRYRDEVNALHHIGITATGAAPDAAHTTSGNANGNSYIERIVYLPATSISPVSLSGFELYVRNVSSATVNSGFVEGSATELDGSERAWFQVEEYRD